MKSQLRFDTFYTYKMIEDAAEVLAKDHPDFVRVHRIGRTLQGRDVILLEVTDFRQGDPGSRPGYYVDGVTHADEMVGAPVALYIAADLAERCSTGDKRALRLAGCVVFYVIPMLNPDGLEITLTNGYRWISNARFLPGEELPEPGFYFSDLNGDGLISQMRIPDRDGEWKISDEDGRVLVLREPDEEDGQYYRLLPEGYIRGWDGATIQMHRTREINLNRTYPVEFNPERIQYGAGLYPLREPETKAVVDWFISHPNIAGVMSYHTDAGLILRPFGGKPDSAFPPGDLDIYRVLGAMGVQETGYPLVSTFQDFTPSNVLAVPRGGTLTDLSYDEYGIPSFTTELWNIYRQAGIEVPYYTIGFPLDRVMGKVLRWVDEHVPNGFVPWRPFEHPQLGPVEVGGWNRLYVFRNPPPALIPQMARANASFVNRLAATLPEIEVGSLTYTSEAPGVYCVKAVIENHGYLPTNLTRQAIETGAARPVLAEISGSSPLEVLDGEVIRTIGHLSGRADRRGMWHPVDSRWGTPRKTTLWVVKSQPGNVISVRAGCPRAGYGARSITLD